MALTIRCQKHPRYNAKRPTKKCPSCSLMYILRHQHGRESDKKLGGINPYQFLGDLQEACEDLEVQDKERYTTPLLGFHDEHGPW